MTAEHPVERVNLGKKSVHSQKGTGCCSIYTGRINQFVNMDTLENQLLQSAEIFFDQGQHWIFQQDGASLHTAHSVRDWFQE